MNTKIEKNFSINQPIDTVWKSLSNPEEIVVCVPGAAITEKLSDTSYKGEVVTKFGPIKAAYAGDIDIVELDEANHKMVLKGRGLDSKGKGSADMIMNGNLTESDGQTHVEFSMDITIVGKLAQFGSRLINDVSDQLLNQFVVNFQKKLDSEGPAEAATTDMPAASAVAAATASVADAVSSAADGVTEAASSVKTTVEKVIEKKALQNEPIDNSLDATSLFGTVIKSIFGSIGDTLKSLFGGGKSK